MDRYRCIRAFAIPLTDDDGRDEEDYLTVDIGEEFVDKGDAFVILDKGDAHLESDDGRWMELPREMLAEYFEKVEA